MPFISKFLARDITSTTALSHDTFRQPNAVQHNANDTTQHSTSIRGLPIGSLINRSFERSFIHAFLYSLSPTPPHPSFFFLGGWGGGGGRYLHPASRYSHEKESVLIRGVYCCVLVQITHSYQCMASLMNVCVYPCVVPNRTRTYKHRPTYMHAYIHTYTHVYIHTYTHTYTYIHTHTHTHTNIHTYTHT